MIVKQKNRREVVFYTHVEATTPQDKSSRCVWRYFTAKGHFQACVLRHFFLNSGGSSDLLSPYYLSLFDQDGWILLKLFFVFSWTRRTRDKNTKKERGQYTAILTEQTWPIKEFIMSPNRGLFLA